MEFFEFAEIAETFFYNDISRQYMWAYLLIAGVCYALVYVFQSIGLYTIACRGGFKNRWMAFVPFLNIYYIGVLADKNKIFNFKAKQVAIVAAALEFAYVFLSALLYIAEFIIFDGGYAVPEYEINTYLGQEVTYVTYNLSALPHGLAWAGTVYNVFPGAVLSWLSMLNLIADVFLLIAFFQTYACKHYVLFSLLSIFFPIKAFFIFAVRNNAGKNYGQYLKEKQQRQYQAYQEYMRQNGGMNNYNNFNNPNGQNPYGGSAYGGNSSAGDPFEGMGSGNGNPTSEGSGGSSSGGDPFEDF